MPGFVPHVTCGRSSETSISSSRSKTASASVGSARQRSSACSQSAPFGAPGRPSRYANVVSSGAIIPARAPASIDMLQIVRRPSIESPLDHRARVLDHVADAAVDAEPADRSEHDVLRGDAVGQLAVEADAQRPRLALRQRLRREHVLDLGGADAERERAERAVRRRVRVAADDRHARLRQPELRADHVHDALAPAAGRVERDAELVAVPLERLELLRRELVHRRVVAGGDVVIHRRERQVGPAHPAAGEAQALERLRRGDLVDEVQVDVEQVGQALRALHEMALPDLVEERLTHASTLARACEACAAACGFPGFGRPAMTA